MSPFIRKLLVALLLAPPFILVWYLGAPYFSALMTVFAGLAAFEVVGMATSQARIGASVVAVVGAMATILPIAFPVPWTCETAIFCTLLAALLVHLAWPGDMSSAANRVSVVMLAAIYASLPISYLLLLRNQPEHGRGLSMLVLASAWFCDSFAYFGGRALGKHKLYPRMSPNKTVEGLFSGMLASGIALALVTHFFALPFSVVSGFGLGVASGLVGQIGDLCESLLKRSFGVKDAGKLLGAHGGVLDRFDAVMFVAPFIWFVWPYLP